MDIKKITFEPSVIHKNITNEVLRDCLKINVTVDEDVVLYVVNLMSLDPSINLKFSSHIDRNSLEEFICVCVNKLSNEAHPSIKTLTIQSYFMRNQIESELIINKQRETIKNRILKLTKEITECMSTSTKEERDKLFNKIVIDIIINNSLGNPTNQKIFNETSEALQSVMSKNYIAEFVGSSRKERLVYLKNIREIVCGIRIFNKDAGYSAEGVIDLIQFVNQSCDSTKSILDITLFDLMDRIHLLTSAIFSTLNYNNKTEEIDVLLPDSISIEHFELLKDILIMTRQQELYVRNIIEHFIVTKQNVENYIEMFRKILEEIHETVQFKTAVSTEEVFPLFTRLGRSWNQIQNQIFVLSHINSVNNYMVQIAESIPPYENIAYNILGTNPVNTDDVRIAKTKVSGSKENKKIEFLGFCLGSLAKGILIPGNINFGLCNSKEKNYLFSLQELTKTFEKHSEKYLTSVIEMCREKPELIVFLDMMEDVKKIGDTAKNKTKLVNVPVQNNITQTELHPIPQNIDKDYTWNIWDLRRKAIQLADLRKCKTTSVQTAMSYENYSVKIQTYEEKQNATQTKIDGYTHAPRFKIQNNK